jgi:hypothetical protein
VVANASEQKFVILCVDEIKPITTAKATFSGFSVVFVDVSLVAFRKRYVESVPESSFGQPSHRWRADT